MAEHELSLAHDLAGHEPTGDFEAVWLEGCERLGTAEAGIVGHARRRGELRRAVRPEHQDPDTERVAPPEGVEGNDPRSVEDDEAPQSMSGPVEAAGATVRTDPVVDLQGSPLDDDPDAEAVGDTDAGRVGAGVGLGERRHGVGDVLGRQAPRLGCECG